MDLNLPKARTLKRDASILKRLVAFILDLLIINIIIVSPFQKVFYKVIDQNLSIMETINQMQASLTTGVYSALFFIGILSLAYFTFFQLKIMQTPGMMILKIRVEGELTFLKALLRNLFILPFFPFYILWIVEPVHLLIRGRRFLEEITKTKTVEEIVY